MKAVLFKRIAAFGALILWLCVIFSFSQESAEESSDTSAAVIDKVATVVVEEYKDYTPPQKEEFISGWQHVTRKAAHFSEFTVLGVLTLLALLTLPLSGRLRLTISPVFCLLCAFLDELSQTFHEGRAMQFTDMLIDFSGALLGILLVWAISLLVLRKKRRKISGKARN